MSTDKNDQEPSMEEILSSIRRIIADDQDEEGGGAKPAAAPAKAKAAKPTQSPAEEDVLDLTQVVDAGEAKPATPPALGADASELDLELEEDDDDEPTPAAAPPKPPAAAPRRIEEGLVSAPTASASTNAFARLAKAAASSEQPSRGFGDKTVEAFLTDLLKPMLKDWLDQNLEGVVERVVEQEVKKLARRAELM